MSGTFSRVSLLLHTAEDPEESDRMALRQEPPANLRGARIIVHEAVHYWQQISQGFLLLLASEEWGRLKAYEQSGQVTDIGEVRREFERKSPSLGFSAQDLHECLARFWELWAIGPRTIIDEAIQTGYAEAHKDFIESDRRIRAELGVRIGMRTLASTVYDYRTAMEMLGGKYADPFLTTCNEFADVALLVFPVLAHFALHTKAPVDMFARCVTEHGAKLAQRARDILGRTNSSIEEQLSYTMNDVMRPAFLACLGVAVDAGYGIDMGVFVYLNSELVDNPVYRRIFEERVVVAGRVLSLTDTIEQASREFPRQAEDDLERVLAFKMIDGFLATPGLASSRLAIDACGLAPPGLRYRSGDVLPLVGECRAQALRDVDNFEVSDISRAMKVLMNRSNLIEEDQALVEDCLKIDDRWSRFIRSEHERGIGGAKCHSR